MPLELEEVLDNYYQILQINGFQVRVENRLNSPAGYSRNFHVEYKGKKYTILVSLVGTDSFTGKLTIRGNDSKLFRKSKTVMLWLELLNFYAKETLAFFQTV